VEILEKFLVQKNKNLTEGYYSFQIIWFWLCQFMICGSTGRLYQKIWIVKNLLS
jgi:hypothetical protein